MRQDTCDVVYLLGIYLQCGQSDKHIIWSYITNKFFFAIGDVCLVLSVSTICSLSGLI